MKRPDPKDVRRVACVGAGVIGGSWAACFLARGYDVIAYDPGHDAEAKLRKLVEISWPSLEQQGLSPGASKDRLAFTRDLKEAVAGAEFIQESGPEVLPEKVALFAEIDAAAPPETVIASSTSAFPMSEIQAKCRRPERTVVAHPINPPHLIPLVEVVGGKRTDPKAVDWAAEFFRAAGRMPLKMDREVFGFVANRLQIALVNEAAHMVANGEATIEQVDEALMHGLAPRWSVMGPFLTFFMGSGARGMTRFMDAIFSSPYARGAAPKFTPELAKTIEDGVKRMADGRSPEELADLRNRRLVAVLKALRQ
ncbi:MAG: 3-hydroxyacyl-CoA dehydrogenase NAD-binding domain-containing protein [Alphaproteobacteria bacterium]